MRGMLAGWKVSVLSKAGRIILIQSVLSVIPIFPMQTFVLLILACKEMEKICRDFLWHGNANASIVQLVNWEKVLQPKKFGRLSFRNL